MKVKYMGHACFLFTSDSGTSIMTDPFKTGGNFSYSEMNEQADIVTSSHDHYDHNYVDCVKGTPQVVRETTKAKGIDFKAIPSYHDDAVGGKRGKNTIFCFNVDGVKVCHLGDLGHRLSNEQLAEIGKVDILLVPVGGFYTIDAKMATEVCEQIKPRVIIPMHWNYKWSVPQIASVEDFLKGKKAVKRLDSSVMEFKEGQLPAATQIMVMKPAL